MSEVRISGLKELDAALGQADKRLQQDLRRELKAIAASVVVGARAKAEANTTRHSGDLIAGIKPFAFGGKFGVESGALHRGYSYPRRLEYEGGGGAGNPGPRASLIPAFEEAMPVVLAETERLLDKTVQDFFGGGTL